MENADIARSILTRRQEVVKRLMSTPEGEELARLEKAYTALTGEHPEPWWNGDHPDAEEDQDARKVVVSKRRLSVRGQVRRILDKEPRVWTYDEITEEIKRLNPSMVERTKSLRTSLRTAVWNLVNDGKALRAEDGGAFWSAKYPDLDPGDAQPARSDDERKEA